MNTKTALEKITRIAEFNKNAFHEGNITGEELGAIYGRVGKVATIIHRVEERKAKRQVIAEYALPRLQSLKEKDPRTVTGVYWLGNEVDGFTFHIATLTEDLTFTGETALEDFKNFVINTRDTVVMWKRDYFFTRYGHLVEARFDTSHYDLTRLGELYTTIPQDERGFFHSLTERFDVKTSGGRAIRDLALKFDDKVCHRF